MKKPTGPCQRCELRTESCHTGCERYKTFISDLAVWKECVREASKDDNEQDALEKSRIKRAQAYLKRNKGKK